MSETIDGWNAMTKGLNPPAIPAEQINWDMINTRRIHDSLVLVCPSGIDQAHHFARQEKEAGSRLKAVPSANIGTFMDNISFKIAAGLRLGCKICQSHK